MQNDKHRKFQNVFQNSQQQASISPLLAIKSNLRISTDNRSSIRVIYLSVVVVLTL